MLTHGGSEPDGPLVSAVPDTEPPYVSMRTYRRTIFSDTWPFKALRVSTISFAFAIIFDATNVDSRAFEGFRVIVERVLDFVDHEVRHGAVDVARELDKARLHA